MVERGSVPSESLTEEITRGEIVEITEDEVFVQMKLGESIWEDGRDRYSVVALEAVGIVPEIGKTLIITDALLNAECDAEVARLNSQRWEELDEEVSPSLI